MREPAVALHELETPCLVIDESILQKNLQRVQDIAARFGLALRPHIKSHKCREIASRQMTTGAVGLTASKVDEALCFAASEFASLTVAYPVVDPRKVERLVKAATDAGTQLRWVVDSAAGVDVLAAAAARLGIRIEVQLKIDVGLHRCGVALGDSRLGGLAERLAAERALSFVGILAHAGQAYGEAGRDGVRRVAEEERRILLEIKQQLSALGLGVPVVSVGSTPTVLAADSFAGITEIRPGNYVFLDRTALTLGLASVGDVALTVLCTVVSQNDDFCIVDAGSKVLSSDLGAHGIGHARGFGLAFPVEAYGQSDRAMEVVRLSEEHGWLSRGAAPLQIGSRVRIIPNHACPVANLADEYVVLDGDAVVDRWPIEARGRTK